MKLAGLNNLYSVCKHKYLFSSWTDVSSWTFPTWHLSKNKSDRSNMSCFWNKWHFKPCAAHLIDLIMIDWRKQSVVSTLLCFLRMFFPSPHFFFLKASRALPETYGQILNSYIKIVWIKYEWWMKAFEAGVLHSDTVVFSSDIKMWLTDCLTQLW